MSTIKLREIDDLVRDQHYWLSEDDECFYFAEYRANAGFSHSYVNQLILNLKKAMDRKDKPEWRHKGIAISECARFIRTSVIPYLDTTPLTIVPIPPSKTKDHERYDDRMLQVVTQAWKGHGGDIRELLMTRESLKASHCTTNSRPRIADIQRNLCFVEEEAQGITGEILLVDDVITTGAHFKACKNVLLQHLPNVRVWGLFIARREIPEEEQED